MANGNIGARCPYELEFRIISNEAVKLKVYAGWEQVIASSK